MANQEEQDATAEPAEEVATSPPDPPFVLTIRVEEARGLFRTQKEEEVKKSKVQKVKHHKKPKSGRGGKKHAKDAHEDDEEEPKPSPLRTVMVLKAFPELEQKEAEVPEGEAEPATAAPSACPPEEGDIMSNITESLNPQYAFETQLLVHDRALFLDNVCSTSLQMELHQCTGPKEQVKGYNGPPQEATELFGALSLDLKALLAGETSIETWIPLTVEKSAISAAAPPAITAAAENKEDGDSSAEEALWKFIESLPTPEVRVTVSLDRPVLSAEELDGCNLAEVTVTRLSSLPAEWAESRLEKAEGDLDFEDKFTLSYDMLMTGDRTRKIQLSSGDVAVSKLGLLALETPETKEGEPTPPTEAPLSGKKSSRPGSISSGRRTSINSSRKKSAPQSALNVDVGFSYSRTTFMGPGANGSLLDSIRAQNTFDLMLNAQRNGLEDRETDPRIHRAGLANVDLTILLKPGITEVEGSFLLKTLEPVMVEPDTSRTKGKGKGGKKSAREINVTPIQTFQDAGTRLHIKISFKKPLNPCRPKLTVAALLGEEKAAPPADTVSPLNRAQAALNKAINDIAERLLSEIAKDSDIDVKNETYERVLDRCMKTGLFGKCLASLIPLFVDVIKNKFYRKMPGKEAPSRAAMLNELARDLSVSVATALGNRRREGTEALSETPLERAVRLAEHNEQAQNPAAATTFYLNAVSIVNGTGGQSAARTYFKYARFSMRQGNLDRAQQTLTRSREHDQGYWPSLVANVLLLLQLDLLDDALPLVDQLRPTALKSNHPVLMMVIALYHQMAEEDEESWAMFAKAAESWAKGDRTDDPYLKQLLGETPRDTLSLPLLGTWSDMKDEAAGSDLWHESLYIMLARLLMSFNLLPLAYTVLTGSRSREPGQIGVSKSPPYSSEASIAGDVVGSDRLKYARTVHLVELFTSAKRYDRAHGLSEQLAAEEFAPTPQAALHQATVQGHLYMKRNQQAPALEHYKAYLTQLKDVTAQGITTSILDPVVCQRIGRLLLRSDPPDLELGFSVADQLAKDPTHCRSHFAWLGLAAAAVDVGKLALAEHALAEASVLNDADAGVWGHVALVALLRAKEAKYNGECELPCGREQLLMEADQAFKFAQRYKLSDPFLLNQLGALFTELQLESHAAVALRAARGS